MLVTGKYEAFQSMGDVNGECSGGWGDPTTFPDVR